MVAPTVVTSTIQLMAALPKKGSATDTASMVSMAWRGTRCASSSPIQPPSRPSSDSARSRRLRAI